MNQVFKHVDKHGDTLRVVLPPEGEGLIFTARGKHNTIGEAVWLDDTACRALVENILAAIGDS